MVWQILALLVASTASAYAGPYLELGLSKADGESCLRDWKEDIRRWGCSDSPLGSVAVGYTYKGFSAEIEHYSSIENRDYGLNLFSIKYRIGN